MTTVAQLPVSTADRPPLPPPEWRDLLEAAAAERGLPPDPWPLPLP